MKALNVRTFFLAAVLALFSFSSCKKNNEDVVAPPPTIEGTWVGKYGSGNDAPSSYFSFIINKDGTLKVKSDNPDKEYNGSGTWKLDGATFTAVYQYGNLFIKYNVAAKTDIGAGTMNGSFGLGDVNPDDGTFFLNRQ